MCHVSSTVAEMRRRRSAETKGVNMNSLYSYISRSTRNRQEHTNVGRGVGIQCRIYIIMKGTGIQEGPYMGTRGRETLDTGGQVWHYFPLQKGTSRAVQHQMGRGWVLWRPQGTQRQDRRPPGRRPFRDPRRSRELGRPWLIWGIGRPWLFYLFYPSFHLSILSETIEDVIITHSWPLKLKWHWIQQRHNSVTFITWIFYTKMPT